jgi:hypothetical protein
LARTEVAAATTSNVKNVFIAGKLMKWKYHLVDVDVRAVQKLVTPSRDFILAKTEWPTSVLDTSLPGH